MELTTEKILELRTKLEQKNSVFSQKSFLDSMHLPSKIIGREKEAEMLLTHILSLKDGFVVPFVSVYGRSGSGKSTVVKFVCKTLGDIISSRFVNLRKAKTVFGCANMIYSQLCDESLSSSEGLSKAIDGIQEQVESILHKEDKKFFVLVLDEYDVIFSDKRGNPSDFVYKLLQMEENLREKGLWVCMITISNNAMQEHDLDDRVKSRMGGAVAPFAPYTKSDVLGILKDRSKFAFKIPIEETVLEYCSHVSSSDHGDARRALDLLRTAGEICDGQTLTKQDIDSALKHIQKDRAQEIVSTGTYQMKTVVGAMCYLAIVKDQQWVATSEIYKKYTELVSIDEKPLSYRRVSDLLVELENSGMVVSRAYSKGRNGYGKEYKFTVLPNLVGREVDKSFYDDLVKQRMHRIKKQKMLKELKTLMSRRRRR